MKTLENKTINTSVAGQIIETKRVLKEKQKYMDNILNTMNVTKLAKETLSFKHFDGAYILKNNTILHGELVEQEIYYYDLKNDKFYNSMFPDGLISDCIEIDDHMERKFICKDLLNKKLFVEKKQDKLFFEHNNIEIPKDLLDLQLNRENLISNGKDIFVFKEYEYTQRKRYFSNNTIYYQIINGTKIKIGNDIEDVINLFFPKENIRKIKKTYNLEYDLLVDSEELTNKELIKKTYTDNDIYFKNDIFYIILPVNDIYYNYVIKIPAIKYKNMKYCILGNRIIYSSEEKKGCKDLNSKYTKCICNNHIMFRNGSLELRDKPYHEYGYAIDNKIILKDKIYDLDFSETIVENGTIIKSNYPIIKKPLGQIFVVSEFFVCIYNDNIYIFYKKKNEGKLQNVFKLYKNFRFERKKSNFYQDKTSKDIFIYSGDDEVYVISKEYYNISSLKLISRNAAIIKDFNNQLFCINSLGYKVSISSLEDYKEFNGNNNIVGFKKDGTIEVNGLSFVFDEKQKKIYYQNKTIWDKVKYENDMIFSSNEYIKNCISNIKVDFKTNYVPIEFSADVLYQSDFLDCYSNSLGIILNLKKENREIKINSSILQQIYDHNKIIDLDKAIVLKGYFVDNPLIIQLKQFNSKLFYNVMNLVKDKEFNCKEDMLIFINNLILEKVVEYANSYNVNIQKEQIENYQNKKDLLTILFNIHNIKDNCSDFNTLALHIGNILKDSNYDFTESNIFKQINIFNRKKFIESGLPLRKFNNFSKELTFKSTTAENRLLKENLCNTILMQFNNLLGSRKNKTNGLFQIESLEDLTNFEQDINMKVSEYINTLEDTYKKQLVKILNKFGKKIYKILKKYNIAIDISNLSMFINNKLPEETTIIKINDIAQNIIEVLDKILENIDDSFKDIELKEFITKYIKWCRNHLVNDFSEVDLAENIRDFKEKEFSIKLWDRKDLITNLVQGNKTHCCIAANSFNVGALINYIYNENIVIVEIKSKGEIIGQAFVYLAKTNNITNYRYEDKYHIFMVIDNVEINSKYSKYTTDIAKNLQTFMYEYMKYVNKDISDVLLGTNYNDIEPPYYFKSYLNVSLLGNKHYIDSKDNKFYKFV